MRMIALALLIATCGCGGGGKPPTGSEATRIMKAGVDPAGRTAEAPTTDPAPASDAPPAADAPLPRTARQMADVLAASTRGAEADVRSWLRGRPAVDAKPPEAVALRALYQQRIYRYLRKRPAFAAEV